MAKKDTIVLNDYPKSRGGARGARVSVEVTAEPLIHDFDEQKLALGPAKAIRDRVEKGIRAISENVSASTLRQRRARGITGSKLFNATGKLARNLTMVKSGDGYETRAPGDRLRDLPRAVIERLFELAKIEPEDLAKDKDVRKSIESTRGVMIRKGRKR